VIQASKSILKSIVQSCDTERLRDKGGKISIKDLYNQLVMDGVKTSVEQLKDLRQYIIDKNGGVEELGKENYIDVEELVNEAMDATYEINGQGKSSMRYNKDDHL
jgi:hypothetical protein